MEELGRNFNPRSSVPTIALVMLCISASLQVVQLSQQCQNHRIGSDHSDLMHNDKSQVVQFSQSMWVSGINAHLVICYSS